MKHKKHAIQSTQSTQSNETTHDLYGILNPVYFTKDTAPLAIVNGLCEGIFADITNSFTQKIHGNGIYVHHNKKYHKHDFKNNTHINFRNKINIMFCMVQNNDIHYRYPQCYNKTNLSNAARVLYDCIALVNSIDPLNNLPSDTSIINILTSFKHKMP